MRLIILFFLVFLFFSFIVVAQDDACPTIVQSALDLASEVCLSTQRNQACYGNLALEAQAWDESQQLDFTEPGDIVNLADIKTLHLSPMDIENEAWGVAMMRIQANLPDSLPGQNLTMLLFGNVEIENAVAPDSEQKPLQAFYFTSGVGDAGCIEMPDSGMIIQTPSGRRRVNLTINDVELTLGSTIHFQAQPSGEMTVSVIEGRILVRSAGQTREVLAGERVRIPLDEHGAAIGPPSPVEPFDPETMNNLPLSLLPEIVTVEESLQTNPTQTPSDEDDTTTTDDSASTNTESNTGFVGTGFFSMNACEGTLPLRAGQRIELDYGIGRWDTPAEAESALAGQTASISVDGQSLEVWYVGITLHTGGPDDPGYGNQGRAYWIATSGTHTLTGSWSGGGTNSCQVTVE